VIYYSKEAKYSQTVMLQGKGSLFQGKKERPKPKGKNTNKRSRRNARMITISARSSALNLQIHTAMSAQLQLKTSAGEQQRELYTT
jgi:hypothetical protein